MKPQSLFVFPPFRLDPGNERLWREEYLLPLRPKAFAVLRYLVEQAGRLVTHEELLQTVWPDTYVSPGLLRWYIGRLREVLGDEAEAPRYIETVARREYRFLAAITVHPVPSVKWQVPSVFVGREAELAQLQGWLAQALRGERQVRFVTGELGIGKTTVVDAFLSGIRGKVWMTRGQCIEHHGAGEAYLPMLEALGRLCRAPEGEQLIRLLSQQAPTWLVQMPALVGEAELEGLQRKVQGATRERMLREVAEVVEAVTVEIPLVLVLEDLQWSDYSTLDLLSYLAQRRGPARLLIIGTYRPADVIVRAHSLKALKQELQARGQCAEIGLRFLTAAEISQYLAARFAVGAPGPASLQELGRAIYHSTEGNPLFMVNMVDYLVARGVIREAGGRWQLQVKGEDVTAGIPESLRQLVEKQLEQLLEEEQQVLGATSVVGVEFSAAAVAAGLAQPVEQVEEWCEGMVRRHLFLHSPERYAGPERRQAARYRFLHALYQSVVVERLTPARRRQLHRRVGEWKEGAYGKRAGETAAELAVHFERGQDYGRAVHYYKQAAQNALQRSAPREAIDHLTKGLGLLQALPDTPERLQQELTLQLTLGAPLVMTRGYAAPEVGKTFARARELCQQTEGAAQFSAALWGLWMFYLVRAELPIVQKLGEQGLSLAQCRQDSTLFVLAHNILGLTRFFQGEFTSAQAHLEQSLTRFAPQKHSLDRSYIDPELSGLLYTAHILWYLGYPDQDRQRSRKALTLAHELAYPHSLAFACNLAATVHYFCGESAAAQEQAEAAIALCSEQGFLLWLAHGTTLRGWALTEQRQAEEGIAQIRQGLATWQTIGAKLARTFFLALLAEVHGRTGQIEKGMETLAEALAMINKTQERFYEAELYRLKGQLTLQKEARDWGLGAESSSPPVPSPQHPAPTQKPKHVFSKPSTLLAGRVRSRWNCAPPTSLARLLHRQGKNEEAYHPLAQIYGRFTKGFDTADLREAKALLEKMRKTAKTCERTRQRAATRP